MSDRRDGEAKEGHCPICKEKVLDVVDDTDLCRECHEARFFEEDDDEIEYRDRAEQLRKEIAKLYKTTYNPVLHDDLIKQVIRSQMQCRHLERIINNNNEKSGGPAKLLQNERTHLRACYNMLQASIQGIRGDKKTVDVNVSKDFADALRVALKGIKDEPPAG